MHAGRRGGLSPPLWCSRRRDDCAAHSHAQDKHIEMMWPTSRKRSIILMFSFLSVFGWFIVGRWLFITLKMAQASEQSDFLLEKTHPPLSCLPLRSLSLHRLDSKVIFWAATYRVNGMHRYSSDTKAEVVYLQTLCSWSFHNTDTTEMLLWVDTGWCLWNQVEIAQASVRSCKAVDLIQCIKINWILCLGVLKYNSNYFVYTS